MFGLLPFVPDKPDVTSYTGVLMLTGILTPEQAPFRGSI